MKRLAEPLTEFRKLVGLKETADRPRVFNDRKLFELVESNKNFRKVIHTGDRSQVALMMIPVDGEIGKEKHPDTEQTFVFLSGTGKAELGDTTFEVGPGTIVVVPPKTEHNFKTVGDEPLRLFTIYNPPNHPPGTVHRTKDEADADEKDRAFQKR